MSAHILLVPFHGQGHLFPFSELCKLLSSRNYKITLIVTSSLSSSISASLRHHSLIQVAELPAVAPSPLPLPDSDRHHHHHHPDHHMAQPLSDFLARLSDGPSMPICAVVDVMMSWTRDTFGKFKIPVVSFFTSGACSAAMEYALWKLQPKDLAPGETLELPGLPEDMRLTFSDMSHKDPPPPAHRPPPGGGGGGGSPPPPGPVPKPGHKPPWVGETEGSIALLINTCDDLERPFIDYVAREVGKPVWGVGPLLPEQYWRSADAIVHDRDTRTKRESNVTEDEVSEWLDSKPRRSVIYVSFGSEVCPSAEELSQLADALDESKQPFIWVVQSNSGRPGPPGGPPGPPGPAAGPPGPPGQSHLHLHGGESFFPDALASRVGGRGLIIRGWAPQLLILSHTSTAGFISHCGWNSTVEAMGRGVPLLAWPIRGDQIYNAKLVVSHLKVGLMVQTESRTEPVKKDEILRGIKRLLADEETRKRAASLRATFDHGFPASSLAFLDACRDFINKTCGDK
ncbi:PREDICTED: scopoletin glucosyltransferase-like [Nelumbo nucifera]|uniref:Glycosyltransferase n=2 Tax=Nelumbo nucifera TaxID=4432 RepID=A0A1U7YQY5_NELNU|nr:PREDICTED: scopoletin glucosyltransferase-like [Nelumbo nucifera]DAD37829.1 TPA_asm: hypothetical protein HUJ06_008470 [Nelumbo nucifera]